MLELEKDSAIPNHGNAENSGSVKPDVKIQNALAGMNANVIAGITTR